MTLLFVNRQRGRAVMARRITAFALIWSAVLACGNRDPEDNASTARDKGVGGHQTAAVGTSGNTGAGISVGGSSTGGTATSSARSVAGAGSSTGGTQGSGGSRDVGSTTRPTSGGNNAAGGGRAAAGATSDLGVSTSTAGTSIGGASSGAAASGRAATGGMTSTAGSTGGAMSSGVTSGSGGSKPKGGSATGGNTGCTPPAPPAAKDSVTLDMAVASGAPTYRASGFIYGISQDGSQPPDATLTDIKVQYLRTGGAQIGCPNGGYVNGQYGARWNAVKAYYAKAKTIGATLLLLVHDVWGADAVCKVPRWPGSGGDWTEYTNFIDQLISDAKANGMTGPDVRWELWNEPDYSGFWGGTQAEWLEMWKRGYRQIRAAIPNAIIEGPSLASGVGGWFNAFLDYVKTNNVIPDYLGWHEAGGGGDPVSDARAARSALSTRSVDVSRLDISEYGSSSEQNPGHSAWFIARLERAGVAGLRSNWGGGSGLYSTLGGLVTASWQPNGQWWIYKRYADQTGLSTAVTAGSQVDAVAYQDADVAKAVVVLGNRGGTTGTVSVVVNNVPAWLQSAGATKILLEKMPNGTAAVTAPTVVSSANITAVCNVLTVTIDWATAADGYVITLTPPSGER
jgi:hypothetical protein